MNMDVASFSCGLFQHLINIVYPPRCILCGSSGFNDMDICARCYQNLPWIEAACSQCALPLPKGSGDLLKCGQCQQKPPAFDHSISLFSYKNDAIKLIHQLKFNEKLANSRLLGGMLATAIHKNANEVPDCIVPVPLHPKRMRQRGFNQSIELARFVNKACRIQMNVRSVVRARDTRSQTALDKKQRRTNIRGAFHIAHAFDSQHVAILDDVVTTTSTVNELANLLKRAGVRRVDVWSIARAV